MKYIKKLIWRMQFKKVKFVSKSNPFDFDDGRCVKCAAGNPIECSTYYWPCDFNEQLIGKYNFKWIKF